MLDITMRVTRSPTDLHQIHMVAVHNTGIIEDDGRTVYDVWLNGEKQEPVKHFRRDGAIELTRIVFNTLKEKDEYGYVVCKG